MRLMKRFLCSLLALVIILPAMALAQTTPVTGSYLHFGHFPQDALGQENAPILWRVLSVRDNQAYLLSELVLDAKPANGQGEYKDFESSTLKAWLNEDFFKAAFLNEEALALLPQENGLIVSLPSANDLRKEEYGFLREEDRVTTATDFAKAQGVEVYRSGEASYWMADASKSSKDSQRRVMEKGSMGYFRAISPNIGVRPAILLDLGLLTLADGLGTRDMPYILSASKEAAVLPSPAPEIAPTAAPEIEKRAFAGLMSEGFPALTEEGFLKAGEEEFIQIDADKGLWRYASQSLRIVIEKTKNEGLKFNVLLAHIFVAAGEQGFHMVPHTKGQLTVNRELYKGKPAEIARENNLVFSMDGDYYIYRVARNARRAGYAIGIVIRDGELVFDMPASDSRSAYPPLDLLALYKNGDMKAFSATEITSAQLLADGAMDVLSFGPVLIRDGKMNTFHERLGNTPQPRAAIGMISPGHYVAVIIEGRITGSKGASVTQTAELMRDLNCQVAFNLDGGWTSAMVFMGKQLNQLDNSGVHNNARTQNEIMGLGYTKAYQEGKVP